MLIERDLRKIGDQVQGIVSLLGESSLLEELETSCFSRSNVESKYRALAQSVCEIV